MNDSPLFATVRAETPMGTRVGLTLLLVGASAIGVAYAAAIVQGQAPAWAPWCLAIGSAATTVGLFVIGAATRRALSRPVAIFLTGLFALLLASFGAALEMAPGEASGGPLLFGLPVRLAIVFYGVGVVPLVVLPVVFGLTFGRTPRAEGGSS